MMRLGLILSLFFASPAFCVAGAEGVRPVAPGLYSVTTEIETEMQDTGTGTLLDTWTEPFSGAACLEGQVSQRVRPETFADTRCSFSNIRPDPYGEAFDLYCVFPEGLLSGSGTLAVDPTRPTEFREAFTLRGAGAVASQRVTIKGRRVGACQLAGQ